MKLKDYTETEQHQMITRSLNFFFYILNPCESVIKRVLDRDAFMIVDMLNVNSEKYKEYIPYAINSDESVVASIPEDMIDYQSKLKVLTKNGWFLKYFKKQTDEMINTAIASNSFAIKYVTKKDISLDDLILVNPDIIQHIKNINSSQAINALKLKPSLIRLFHDTKDDDIMEYVIKNNPSDIIAFDNPPPHLQMYAVKYDRHLFYSIIKPHKSVIDYFNRR